MNILEVPFELLLKKAVHVNGFEVSRRSGFRIQFEDSRGFIGVGECVPLPGLHRESLEDCKDQWDKIKDFISGAGVHWDTFDLSRPFLGMMDGPKDLFPALSFALEQALLNIYLAAHPGAFEKLFNIRSDVFSTRVNGLFVPCSNDFENIEDIAEEVLTAGFQTVKVKVGHFSVEQEVSLIKSLNQRLKGKCRIRLDGNCLFSEEGFQSLADGVRNEDIEYIEEPLNPLLVASQSVYRDSPIPIALDESLPLYLRDLERGMDLPNSVHALVVKPTTFGGIHKTVRLIQLCNQKELKCVISSAFDTGWTIVTHALLAQLVKTETAMGLDTYKYLKTDTLSRKLDYRQGKLFVSKSIYFNLGKRYG